MPGSLAFHYGQTIFEGMKAFRMEDDRIHIFRPEKHYERLKRSAARLCMPVVSRELFFEALRRLVYFPRPVRVKVEREFARAASGGTGYAKCGGNYGGALYPTELAKAAGYDQVLWTDGVTPIAVIGIDGRDYELPVVGGKGQGVGEMLKLCLEEIRYGRRPDVYQWNDYVATSG